MLEEPALPLDTAAISGQGTIRANHPMARHNHTHRIRSIRQPNRSNRTRPSDPFRKLPIGNRSAAGNLSQCPPHLALKIRTHRLYRQFINRIKLARKISPYRFGQTRCIASLLYRESIFSILNPQGTLHTGLMFIPLNSP